MDTTGDQDIHHNFEVFCHFTNATTCWLHIESGSQEVMLPLGPSAKSFRRGISACPAAQPALCSVVRCLRLPISDAEPQKSNTSGWLSLWLVDAPGGLCRRIRLVLLGCLGGGRRNLGALSTRPQSSLNDWKKRNDRESVYALCFASLFDPINSFFESDSYMRHTNLLQFGYHENQIGHSHCRISLQFIQTSCQ
jgi:hypothetical protein